MSYASSRHVVRTVTALVALSVPLAAFAANLSGAIFTTTADGGIVNENTHYETKPDVYLDGGPGPNAPASAAGLPEGDYYYQVTDPSGKDLLSSDNISCRRVHVNSSGVIDSIYSGTNYASSKGSWVGTSCTHVSGTDLDHAELGAKTVQLYPYDDTPNPGGVYKVWLTPTASYTGSTGGCSGKTSTACNNNGESYTAGNYHGFVPSQSKTDNYKVKFKGKTFTAPYITVSKFHDADMSGVQGEGEETVTGWAVDVTDITSVVNTVYTTATYTANAAGDYTFVESTPSATLQTVAYRDGVVQSQFPTASASVTVTVANTSGETHSVVYGNVGLGSFDACKVFDRNGNGVQDEDETLVEGWQFNLTGTTILGGVVSGTEYTDSTGCASWDDLLPGTYTVTEGVETSGTWYATSPTSVSGTVTSSLSGSTMVGTALSGDYTNQRILTADFGTKGYWHNQNGLAELTQADINEVNGLDPYRVASEYFGGGDEPFDGLYSDGTAVCNSLGGSGDDVAPCGSFQAEVSQYLTDANAGGTHEEQLAQQLLAFIFNAQHRVDSFDVLIIMADGSLVSMGSLIEEALYVWNYGSDAEIVAMQTLLESFNSSDAVGYIPNDAGTPSF